MTPDELARHERGIALLDAAWDAGDIRSRSADKRREVRVGSMKQRLAARLGFKPPPEPPKTGGRRGS